VNIYEIRRPRTEEGTKEKERGKVEGMGEASGAMPTHFSM